MKDAQILSDFRDNRRSLKKTMEEKCVEAMTGLKDHVIHVASGFPWMAILKTARALVCRYKQFCVGQEEHTITLQKKYCVEGYL